MGAQVKEDHGGTETQRGIEKNESVLLEKLADEPLLLFVFDASEEFGAEFLDCLGSIERQALVHDTAAEVTRLAARGKDWFDLSIEVYL